MIPPRRGSEFWDRDDFNYWGIESQNGFTYLAYQKGVWRFSDTNGSVAASGPE